MKSRTQRFLLFTFAFLSALTFIETLETSRRVKNANSILKSTTSNLTESQPTKSESGSVRSFLVNHGLEKRSAEVFSQIFNEEKDKKQNFYEPNLSRALTQNVPDKRVRLGFTGMRGKKEYSADDYCARNMKAKLEGALNKKYFNELLGGKRARMAFHEMCRKKFQDFESKVLDTQALDSSSPSHQDFLLNSGLMEEPSEFSSSNDESEGEEGLSKRSPYSFLGMRGKKDYTYDLKRAMGFLGMRGKKATETWDLDSNYKRVPQTSFFGMKGKKAQSNGFFGMRGKKASPNNFFGSKGKHEPLAYDFQDFSILNQMKELGPSNNRFRRGITWLNNSKKAKNAFFGIRGKKSTQERSGYRFSPSF